MKTNNDPNADVFLTYANCSLRNKPETFKIILDKIVRRFLSGEQEHIKTQFDFLVGGIVKLAKADNPEIVDQVDPLIPNPRAITGESAVDRSENLRRENSRKAFLNASKSVYGFRNGFCEEQCEKRYRREIFADELFSSPGRLKCFECDQLGFLYVLDKIVEGIDFSEIEGFPQLLNSCNDIIVRRFSLFKPKRPTSETEVRELFAIVIPELLSGFDFNQLLESIVAYTLATWLKDYKNRYRLKKCSICGDYFIAKNVRRQICYPPKKCRNAYKVDHIRKERQDNKLYSQRMY